MRDTLRGFAPAKHPANFAWEQPRLSLVAFGNMIAREGLSICVNFQAVKLTPWSLVYQSDANQIVLTTVINTQTQWLHCCLLRMEGGAPQSPAYVCADAEQIQKGAVADLNACWQGGNDSTAQALIIIVVLPSAVLCCITGTKTSTGTSPLPLQCCTAVKVIHKVMKHRAGCSEDQASALIYILIESDEQKKDLFSQKREWFFKALPFKLFSKFLINVRRP